MRSVVLTLLGVCLAATAARATAPIGGDESGFVPSSPEFGQCQERATKNAAKLGICLAKCHVTHATHRFDGDASFTEEFCEAACVVRYREKALGILLRNTCPVCLDQTAFGSAIGAFLDARNDLFFCAGTTPLGDDDTGFVPPDHGTLLCEGHTLLKAANLQRCVLHCHAQQALRLASGGTFDDEACEDRCQVKLVAGGYPGTCPSCLAFLPSVGGAVRQFLDAANSAIYCESPGGAFLDPF